MIGWLVNEKKGAVEQCEITGYAGTSYAKLKGRKAVHKCYVYSSEKDALETLLIYQKRLKRYAESRIKRTKNLLNENKEKNDAHR